MRRTVPLPLLLAIATLFGVSSTVQAYWLERLASHNMPDMVGHLLLLNAIYWYIPACVAPLVFRAVARFPFRRGRWYLPLGIHALGAVVYAVLHTTVMLGARAALMPTPPRGWWVVGRFDFLTQLDWLFTTYLFLVGLAHALAYRAESEQHALDSAKLETRLVEAQLQALQRQLHPHFLFNTLNAIAGLMRVDVNAADMMIGRLGDLLRATLRSSNIQEVPLRVELDVLRKYVEIEQLRFGDRLGVTLQVDPDTLAALVPNFMLQPLVENAIRHGVAPHARPGRVNIRAARDGGQLVIRVADSGDGVTPQRQEWLSTGIGLANTRARLEHLYPGTHALLFADTDGGFAVTVRIPFVADRAPGEPRLMGVA